MDRAAQTAIILERLCSSSGLPRPRVSKLDVKNSHFVVCDVDVSTVVGEGADIVEAVDAYTDSLLDRVKWLGLDSPFSR